MIGVTRRVLANARRGRRRAAALRNRLGLLTPLDAPVPAERVADDDVRRGLLALRRLDREALVLVAWFDLTPAEAAVALGVAPAAFRMRLARARRRLRVVLTSESPARPRIPPSKEQSQCQTP